MNGRKKLWSAILIATIFIGIVSAETSKVVPLEIGAAAPDFNLPGVDGREYRLADFADANILVIVFTANHCPTAQAYESRLMQLVTDYKSKGVAVAAISPNDPQAVRLDEMGYTDMGDSFEEMSFARLRESLISRISTTVRHKRQPVLMGPLAHLTYSYSTRNANWHTAARSITPKTRAK